MDNFKKQGRPLIRILNDVLCFKMPSGNQDGGELCRILLGADTLLTWEEKVPISILYLTDSMEPTIGLEPMTC